MKTQNNTNIQVFQNSAFGEIRTATTDSGEPLFCLADICKILELRQGDVKQRLDKGVVSTQPLETAGGKQEATFVNSKIWFCLNDVMKSLGLSNVTELKNRLLQKGIHSMDTLTKGGRPLTEYPLTLDTAKEISIL